MRRTISNDQSTTVDHFRTHGWMRVPGAFSAGEAAAMREAVWRAPLGKEAGGRCRSGPCGVKTMPQAHEIDQ